MEDKAHNSVKIEVYDTTLRDGAQSEGVSFSLQDKILVAKRLDEMGFDYIEGGWPGSNPKDIMFFKEINRLKLKNAQIAAFGSTRRAGIKVEDDSNIRALIEAGTPVVTIFGKSWILHVREALRTSLDENLKMIEESVKYLKKHGKKVVYDAEHFFDGYKDNPEYAMKTLEAATNGGADVLVLADTNGGSLPHEVEEITKKVVDAFSVPVGIHAHNDSGCAVANSIAAVKAGATHVQGTINGLGERCGNADLIVLIANLQLKMGFKLIPDEKLQFLYELSRFISEVANQLPNPRQPYVGESAFAHKGGVHVSAVQRNPRTYEHIDPAAVGNRRKVLVSELSGQSNVIAKAKELGIQLEKNSPQVKEILKRLKNLEAEGYHFEAAEGSFELLLREVLGQYKPFFNLEGFRVIVEKLERETPIAEATIKINVLGKDEHTAAEGDGPVNALDKALRKALARFYDISGMRLVDYKVRVIDPGEGTAAKVRVLITSTDGRRVWRTVGVSTNIIEASWQALVDSVEYYLFKTTGR